MRYVEDPESFDVLDGIIMVMSKLSWRRFRGWLRRRRDTYDPRKSEYVAPAAPEEVERLRVAQLQQHISKLEAMLLRRPDADRQVREHYANMVRELQVQATAAECRAEALRTPMSPAPETEYDDDEFIAEAPRRARFDSELFEDVLEEVVVPRRARFDSELLDAPLEEDKEEEEEALHEPAEKITRPEVAMDPPRHVDVRLRQPAPGACRPRWQRRQPSLAQPKC
mmetsp:Transcript_31645/g.90274  ORF Transcript_31645/g.90274 Transcript_31645/m.90274 type:complete len:225 (-) Transcript_31645:239-913(-)